MADEPTPLPPMTPDMQELLQKAYNLLPPKWQKLIAAGLTAGGLLAGFIVGHNTPRPVTPVNVTTDHKIEVVEVKPEPQAPKYAYTFYVTKDTTQQVKDAMKSFGVEVSKVYDAGLTIGGAKTPCLVKWDGNRIVDAVAWTDVNDATKWVRK